MIRERYLLLGALLAASLVLLAGPGRARADDGVDVFFVTDDSPSMKRFDPSGSRIRLLKALCDFLLHPGGDRAAVLRLGGALESKETGILSYPFTDVSSSPEEKAKLLFEMKTVFDTPARGFGRGTDFFHLFHEGLFPVLKEREEARPAVVVLVTDGRMNVIEGSRVHPAYRKALTEGGGRVSRAGLTSTVYRLFRSRVLPLLRDSRIVVVPVAVAKSPATASPVLRDLARRHIDLATRRRALSRLCSHHLLRFLDADLTEVVEHLVGNAEVETAVRLPEQVQGASPRLVLFPWSLASKCLPVLLELLKTLPEHCVPDQVGDRPDQANFLLEKRTDGLLRASVRIVDFDRSGALALDDDVAPDDPGSLLEVLEPVHTSFECDDGSAHRGVLPPRRNRLEHATERLVESLVACAQSFLDMVEAVELLRALLQRIQ